MTAKQQVLEAINELPQDARFDEMMERIYFLAKVERGLRQIEAGQVVSHEEVKRQFGR